MSKNPNWVRDELILALDLYFRCGRKQLPHTNQEVIELSQLLNMLPIHNANIRGSDFRNPRGVSMKLGNFLSIDPQYLGEGLRRVSKEDKEVWDDFAHDYPRLVQTALSISNSVKLVDTTFPDSIDAAAGENEFPERRILTYLHQRRERNQKAVAQKKHQVLRATGMLLCEVCDFDFARVYGSLGEGFAECHHTIPLAQLSEDYCTRLDELAIVCANCHRMLHRSRPMLSIHELRAVIQKQHFGKD